MKKFIKRKLGLRLFSFGLLLVFATFTYGWYGMKYNKDLFTNAMVYDEMAGMIPLLILVSSGLFLIVSVIIKVFTKNI